MAIFTGGLAQLLAGMWEFPRDNTFGGTAFSSYGAFWMSYAMILLPGTGIITAYKVDSELRSALGIYLLSWAIVTWFFLCVFYLGMGCPAFSSSLTTTTTHIAPSPSAKPLLSSRYSACSASPSSFLQPESSPPWLSAFPSLLPIPYKTPYPIIF